MCTHAIDGYMAESSASELLLGLDIPEDQHYGLMSEIAPGWKLRVLLAQACINHTKIFKSKLILTQNPQSLTITNANRTARWG
jgi:hypothetical protein